MTNSSLAITGTGNAPIFGTHALRFGEPPEIKQPIVRNRTKGSMFGRAVNENHHAYASETAKSYHATRTAFGSACAGCH